MFHLLHVCIFLFQIHSQNDGIHHVQSMTDSGSGENVSVDLSEATLSHDGQLIITGEDGI